MFKPKRLSCLPLAKGFAILLLSLVFVTPVSSEKVDYIFDNIGRLIKAVSETGDTLIYNYDEVGNLLSISRQTAGHLSPSLNSVNPDIVFAGTTIPITISGANLLTAEDVWSDNSSITVNSFTATDTTITTSITVPPDATLGATNINVKTLYGTASIPVTLARLTFNPSQAATTVGSAIEITAGITGTSGNFNLSLNNKNPDIINAPQFITIPAGGFTTFTVTALKEGVGIITAENVDVTIYVTQPFTGNATASAAPVSVEWSYVPDGAVTALPVSIGWSYVPDGAVTALPVSVEWSYVPDGAVMSLPVSIKINTQ